MGNLIQVPHSEVTATLEVLAMRGLTAEDWSRPRTDGSFADRLVKFWLSGGVEGTIHERLARAVAGQNFWGPEEWATLYGARFTKKQIREAEKFPWGEDVLNSPCPFNSGKLVKDTHFAFLGTSGISGEPLTVAKWLDLHPATGQPKFYFNNNPWHKGQPHTDVATTQLRWYLMLKDIAPGSTDKTPEEQGAMLPEGYEVPTTIAETTKDILVFRKTRARPNSLRWAACTERTVKTDKLATALVGSVSCVGAFDEHGLRVGRWVGNRDSFVGVGASRKF